MATYEGKDGKKSFHMNPQMGKALKGGGAAKGAEKGGGPKGRGGGGLSHGREDKIEESLVPGLHQKVEMASEKLGKYDGHAHKGLGLAHHVEIHHGGHSQGSPPAHEGHTHHTISHHQGHGGGGFGGGFHGGEGRGDQFTEQGGLTSPTIANHESFQEAMAHAGDNMHDGCPNCEGTDVGHEQEPTEEADYGGSSEDSGIPV